MNRREVLKLGVYGGGLWLSGLGSRIAFAKDQARERRLVVIYLYGGADPLSLFPPIADDLYYNQRSTLAVKKTEARPLDQLFALHSALNPLYPLWQNGEMAVIHQFGLPQPDRSHANATNLMETGIMPGQAFPLDGFLSRAIVERFGSENVPLRNIAVQVSFPTILSGAAGAMAFSSIDELRGTARSNSELLRSIELFEKSTDPTFRQQGRVVRAAIEKARSAFPTSSGPRATSDVFQFQLHEIARLIQADIGVRLAFTSTSGWDTHVDQQGDLLPLMTSLGKGLADLRDALKKTRHWDDTMVLVVTEFGRTVRQNGSGGTDHGNGSAAILLGGALGQKIGGKVVHQWKPMTVQNLSEGRDLVVCHDYRNVFGELLISQFGLTPEQLKRVFPLHDYKKIGLLA
jgi:uncharacterized protein (DUF1501 family)